MIVVSHPTGNEFVRYTLSGLNEMDLLHTYYTSIACFEGDMMHKLGAKAPFTEFRKRAYQVAIKKQTQTNPFFEMMRQLALKANIKSLLKHEFGMFSVDKVYQNHDHYVASQLYKRNKSNITGVYAYEDAAIETFTAAKELGINSFYDLSIGYWKAAKDILEKEKERRPEYANTLTGLMNSAAKLERKDREIELANEILVASKFTAETLKMYQGNPTPIHIIPYGFPTINKVEKKIVRKTREPLKILFVGGLTQRKGIAEVLDSANIIGKEISLTVIGRETSATNLLLREGLKSHRYFPSLPHDQILAEMYNHDVLLFPSFFEGFGMVISEAMSQGIPVITTMRTGAADFIEHGINGWMVEPGNINGIIEILESLIKYPELHHEAGKAAKVTANKRPWAIYAKEISELIAAKSMNQNIHKI